MRFPFVVLSLVFSGLLAVSSFSRGPAAQEPLRVATANFPTSLGVPFTSVGQPSSGVWTAMFDALTVIDPDGVLTPGLALSWSNVDEKTWRFTLREGVTYHSGRPFTAETAADVIALLLSDAGRAFYVTSTINTIAEARAISATELEIVTSVPDPLIPQKMSIVYMIDPDAWAELGRDGFAAAPIGTGPFQLEDWGRTEARIQFIRHDDTWRRAKVERMEMLVIPDAFARLQALLSDQIDVVGGLSPDDLDLLDPDLFYEYAVPSLQIMAIAMRNVGNPDSPLQLPAVRSALNHAVDVQGIADAFFRGEVDRPSQGVTAGTFGFNPALSPYTYDPGLARQMLADEGYPDGFDLQMEVMADQGPGGSAMYQKVAHDLRAIGLDVTMRSVPFSNWLEKFTSGRWGEVDAFSFVWDSGAYADASRPISLHSCNKPNPFFCDDTVMDLINAANEEMDLDLRREELQRILARSQENPPSILLVPIVPTYGVSSRITTFRARSHGIYYAEVEKAE